MKTHPRRQRGFALILTLFMVVIVTILLVGFVLSMRTERMAAAAMARNERAKIIAQDALEHAIALLDNNIPQPIPPGTTGVPENWIISPGLLTKYSGADGSTPTYIPLSTSTNAVPTALPSTDYANLNAKQLSTGNYPIIPTGEPVPMSWMYLLKDPTSPASATNPIIGRYAFWMDDENARININTAYGKPSTVNLNRSNPLDQSANNGYTWYGKGFDANVGFNSLVGASYTSVGSDGITYTLFEQPYPNSPAGSHGTPAYPPGSTTANAVGNTTITGPVTTGTVRYYPLWHPAGVNIDILPTSLSSSTSIGSKDLTGFLDRNSLADWVFNKEWADVHTYTQNWRLLQDPSQIQQFITTASPGPANFYQANEFNLTAYNRAPEFNAFGKPRLLMEARIQSKGITTSAPDTCFGNASGTELAFYNTPDLDPQGPMYFHGRDNNAPYTGSTTFFYPDLNSVQMVGDYLSGLLVRKDWPGMPATSFVAKWGGSDTVAAPSDDAGRREADQVAWNIVAMGNYGSNSEGDANSGNWPDDQNQAYLRNTLACTVDNAGLPATGSAYATNYLKKLSSQSAGGQGIDPNKCLRLGKLSGKAIMPYSPKASANEVALVITAVPVDPVGQPGVFYLKVSMQVELYAGKRGPPGSTWGHWTPSFGLTHFFYTVSGTDGTGAAVNFTQQSTGATTGVGDGGVSDGYPNNQGLNSQSNYPWAECLGGGATDPPVSPADPQIVQPTDGYMVMATAIPWNVPAGAVWIANKIRLGTPYMLLDLPGEVTPSSTTNSPYSGPPQPFKGIVNIKAKARLFLSGFSSGATWQIVPVWDNVDTNLSALKPPTLPTPQSDSISWNNISLDLSTLSQSSGGTFYRSVEVTDPRLGGNSTAWVEHPSDTSTSNCTTLGFANAAATTAGFDPDSFAYFDFQGGGSAYGLYPNSPRPSIGFLSCVPTGMQRGLVNSTLMFGPSASKSQLPDWLMLDLVAPSFMDVTQPSFAPYSYLHSTMGKININSSLYPTFASTSGTTVSRWLPLQALFQNMNSSTTVASASSPSTVVSNIINHTLSGQDFGAQGQYDYIGELCEVAGVADTGADNWQKEALIRNLANLITTQSNTFHVWGAAQSIQVLKGAGNTNYGAYESGDTVIVQGEKRFESVIERSVWPGVDGVPGNGHVNGSGAYDHKSTNSISPLPVTYPWAAVPISSSTANTAVVPNTAATWAQFDGPDNPNTPRISAGYTPYPGWYGTAATPLTYTSTLLINANNPARAHMTYKPIMFRYQTE